TKALAVLERQKNGFVLMVEGASIDKQAHNMDTERWMLDTLEFDRTVAVAQEFARRRGDTIVIVTADHECSGAALIGGSRVTDARLQELVREGGVANVRDKVVGIYEQAGFPAYRMARDGYPETTDTDFRLLVGYGANADRHEDWRTNARPLQDSQQPMVKTAPLSGYPASALARDADGRFMVTGQVPGESAVHTATDIPLSAFGPGAWSFTGVIDNTDVFFRLAQAAVRGVVLPEGLRRAGARAAKP
ncbi:MAG: alkaline phosphatase, partial [Burkholderiaceae bacterium]|nr:alkaline phosphatase [Burkholderiaceae bacterium]